MPDIRLATWNINSIRARIDRLTAWLDRQSPDIVCLQETKCTDDQFPFDAVREAGYEAVVWGQKTYNGVAILAREAPPVVTCGLPGDPDDSQARLIAASIHGIDVVNIYVPNGQSVGTDKYEYKLAWLARLEEFMAERTAAGGAVVLCGDFNIAPADEDVAFPEQWASSVLCHEAVRQVWNRLIEMGLHDLVRTHQDAPGPYTWWDYRRLAFPRGDGIRIDHILGSGAARDRCTGTEVDRDERKGEKPSDHAPVFARFSV